MRICIVVQRYGPEITGGAESHARSLAHALADRGHQITVLTTTSSSYQAWDSSFSAGRSSDGSVNVERFAPRRKSRIAFGLYKRVFRIIGAPKIKHHPLERLWFTLQGPYVPDLLEKLVSCQGDFEAFVFFSYLYFPTVLGLPIVADRAIIVPTAHDEDPLFFDLTLNCLKTAQRIFCNSAEEARLVGTLSSSLIPKIDVVGIGVEPPFEPDEEQVEGLRENFFLYMGRVSKDKNVDRLIALWKEHNLRKCLPIQLVLAGEVSPDLEGLSDPNVVLLGRVSSAQKSYLFRRALAIVNPSHLESLSLLALEAMLSSKPLLVNRRSKVLEDYSRQFPTVIPFDDAASFFEAVDRIHTTNWGSPETKNQLITAKKWVEETYSWDSVINKFETATEQIIMRQ